MNKVFLAGIFLFLLTPMVVCSDSAIGIKAGINLGWFGGRDWEDYLNYFDESRHADTAIVRIGFSGGFFVTLGLFRYFSLQPEILISNLGGNYKYNFLGLKVEGVESYTVIEIPVMLRPQLPLGPANFFIEIGPDIAFIIAGGLIRETVEGVGIFKADIEPDNRVVWGITVGMGYEYEYHFGHIGRKLLGRKISIDVRYSRALTRIYNDFEQYQNALTIMFGFGYLL